MTTRLTVAMALFLSCAPAQASILFYNLFKVQGYSQTTNAQPVTPFGFQGTVNVNASLAGDLSGGTVTTTSPLSPMTLTGSGGNYAFGLAVGTKSLLDTDFPNAASYTFNLTSGTFGGQSATLTSPAADAYSATVPFFTGNAFTALQGFNAANAITLTFNPYTAPGGVNTPLIFVSINRVSDGSFAYSTSGSNTLSSASVAAGTLLPGTQYDAAVIYSARVQTSSAAFGGSTSFTAYDLRTDLVFTTASAVPEPSALLLTAAGIGLVATLRRRLNN